MTRTWRKRETQSTGRAILVVDDQGEILVSTRLFLEGESHTFLAAAGGADALALFHDHPDLSLIIINYFMSSVLSSRTDDRRDLFPARQSPLALAKYAVCHL